MLASGGREATYALFAFCCVVLKAEGFLSPLTLPIGGVAKGVHSERRCIRVPRLSVTPPGKSNGGTAAAGSEESGGTFAGEEGRGIRRAPLRITPNFQPQENRRPKTDVESDPITYGAFLTEQSFDIAGELADGCVDFGGATVVVICFETTDSSSSSVYYYSSSFVVSLFRG